MEGSTTIKTYYTRSRVRYLSASTAFALLALIALAAFIQSPGDWTKSLLAGALGLLAFVIAFFLFIGSRSRIITSPQGLEYHTAGFSIFTAWDNIERIDQIPTFKDVRPVVRRLFTKNALIGFAGQVEGLVLRQPVAIKTSRWEGKATETHQHIILSEEFKMWRGSGLEQDFRQYAPHLFGQATQ